MVGGGIGRASPGLAIAARVVVAVVGGYAASAGLAAAASVGMAAAGMAYSEAAMASFLIGIIVYLILLTWAFAERRLLLLTVVLASLAAAGFGVAALAGRGG